MAVSYTGGLGKIRDIGRILGAGGSKKPSYWACAAILEGFEYHGTLGARKRQRDRQRPSCRGKGSMSNELIALVAVGAALAGLILTTSRGLRQDMKQGEARLEAQINGLRGEVNQLRERMSHLEGLLEGLREAITGRVTAR